MSVLTETFTLSNGDQIPKIGFGTWLLNVEIKIVETDRTHRGEGFEPAA